MTDEPPVELHDGEDEQAVSRVKLARLKTEHRDLDHAIIALEAAHADQLRLTRLKRQKLRLREEIQNLEDSLLPDIIA
ncbi:MAG: DUF465 domain-containing protein [Pseudomonadota bacterium]